MFCGECGVSVAAPRLVEPTTKPRPGDTAIIEPLEVAPTQFIGNAISPPAARPPTRTRTADAKPTAKVRPKPVPPVPVPPVAVPPVAESPVAVPAVSAPPAPPATVPEPPVGPAPARISLPPKPAPPRPAPPVSPLSMPATPVSPVDDPPGDAILHDANANATHEQPSDLADQHSDLEETRIVASRLGDRFVLQFSTGENSTVYGTGLVGRNPVTQPGEYVDQVVTILDPGKSVSKTHIEFGQTAGTFWVVDRYSANGTIVRQPDAPPQRLDPGKRQPIARGTRVDMGEQFFVVS